jgi:porphobilinogen synthase
MRELVAQHRLNPENLMLPIFIREGLTEAKTIEGMYQVQQHSEQSFLKQLDRAIELDVKAVMLFAIPTLRDATGSQACELEGILARSVRSAKSHSRGELVIVADLCLDEFTDHGHCGVLDSQGRVDNDQTLMQYQKMAVALATAGADVLGASGMMDGQVLAVRTALDEAGFHEVAIMAYAAKYASSFYGPFRNAVESQLQSDRKTYQQDWRNLNEAIREIELDLAEGADIIMVKPALSYLDVVRAAAEIANVPVAAYLVSGELAMVEAAAAAGHINRKQAILETTHSAHRAGASIVCTYWALEVAQWLRESN